jgi:hypothetical protein
MRHATVRRVTDLSTCGAILHTGSIVRGLSKSNRAVVDAVSDLAAEGAGNWGVPHTRSGKVSASFTCGTKEGRGGGKRAS